ncbi:suppressor of fused domain protein [Kutzneria chonburiensis]|uniref:Suppressor of fused domain protein n=1 Tax=Kutzneria chonburiensis TaxID=1483604 RepID=A0ABV6MML8_9PSEU|nr:suppressor of fused domain protein [Kutzneria chonburiensis]
MTSRVDRYLAHLDALSGGVEAEYKIWDSTKPGLPAVTSIVYRGLPEGLITGLTYGLSLAEHEEWPLSKPELCISVRSEDPAWAIVAGNVAQTLRGSCPFCYGDTINFGEPISPESTMTAFVVGPPAVLDPADYTDIDVGEERPVSIAGLFPIHDVERQYIREHGLDPFIRLDWDCYDVARPPAV